MNDLLLWMSVRGAGSLASFREGAGTYWAKDLAWQARRAPFRTAMWNLDKLGHAEFGRSAAGAGWRVAPAVAAVSLQAGEAIAIMCGSRPPSVIDAACSPSHGVRAHISSQADGPDRIQLAAASVSEIASFAIRIGAALQWNAPDALLSAQVAVRAMRFEPTSLPVSDEWEIHRFSKSKKRWAQITKAGARVLENGLLRYRSERGTSFFLRESSATLSCPEVATGKFRALPRRSRAISYDAARCELWFDAGCRPPPLVERALVISSGRLPENRSDHLVYLGISRSTVQRTSDVLGQRVEEATS